nr:FecR family protein [Pedobacter panaciterrae]
MKPEEFISLYEKYISGSCSIEEEQLLLTHKDSFKLREEGGKYLVDDSEQDEQIGQRVYQRINQTISTPEPKTFRIGSKWWTLAAIILLTLTVGIILFNYKSGNVVKREIAANPLNKIKQGSNKAILTLADGSKIVLTGTANGNIANQAGVSITKSKDGELIYTVATKNEKNVPPVYNQISTPRGGQYELVLPDGTKVWLNAASSLKYPTYFAGNERSVQLDGEAYFEVKKNLKMPFKVNSGNATVEVLGTHFNIKAYDDEDVMKTTLLEGAVRLHSKNSIATLKPGQQAVLSNNGGNINVKEVKTSEAVAWKDGYFIFKDTNLRDIMNQISRWYDVDIEYQCDTKDKSFGGIYSKNKDINELLKGLELTKLVHFKIEGRRIVVTR